MAGMILRRACEADHPALETLFRATPMGSQIHIGIERDPDYFAGARVQAGDPVVHAAFANDGRAVGVFSAGKRRIRLGDGETWIRYLSDLRIHPDWQGTPLLSRGFRMLRNEVFQAGEWAQTLVLESNLRALELLASQRGGLPEYRPAGRYASWLLPRQRVATPLDIQVRKATAADLAEMQAVLDDSGKRRSFSEIVKFADLGKATWRDLSVSDFLVAERQGRISGMMGIWDQSGFQRLRIRAYPPVVAAMRPVWNAWARFCGGVALPRCGTLVPLRKATAIACHDDDSAVLRALLASALAGNDDRLLLLGMSAADPLTAALRGLKARVEYGRHFLVGWDGAPPVWREPFAFDVARI